MSSIPIEATGHQKTPFEEVIEKKISPVFPTKKYESLGAIKMEKSQKHYTFFAKPIQSISGNQDFVDGTISLPNTLTGCQLSLMYYRTHLCCRFQVAVLRLE